MTDSGWERMPLRVILVKCEPYGPVLRIIPRRGTILSRKRCKLILEYLSMVQKSFSGLKLDIESRGQK